MWAGLVGFPLSLAKGNLKFQKEMRKNYHKDTKSTKKKLFFVLFVALW